MSSRFEIATINKGLFNKDIIAQNVSQLNKKQALEIKKYFENTKKKNPYQLTNKQLKDLSEEDTIDYYVIPILEKLGFSYRKKHSDKNKKFPDIWLFTEEPKETSPTFFQSNNLTIIEAKAYSVDLDKGDGREEKPPAQILKYIGTNCEYNPRKKWGVLTNGYKWRLYSIDGIEKYIEFDIDHALEDLYELEIFCAIFSTEAFKIRREGDFLSTLREQSLDSWVKITDEIKSRGNEILLELTKGFYAEKNTLVKSKDLAYDVLFKLLYVLYIESKNLIPKGQIGYTDFSLRVLLHEIYQIHFDEYEISNRLSQLFDLYSKGKGVLPQNYGGEHFSFNNKIIIKNEFLKKALKLLTVFEEDKSENKFFDYSSLNVELVGNIYEATMALDFKEENESVIFKKIIKKTGSEVHSSGTTYTPPNVVKYLIEESFPEVINSIPTVCDPACGSGHFLVQALRFLSKKITFEETKADTLQGHIRIIAQNALFGTDINSLAAKLARLMLALETSEKGESAIDFTKNIKSFNALLMKWKDSNDWIWQFDLMKSRKLEAFDFIVGNPPYVRADEPGQEKNRKEIKDSKQYSYLYKKWDLFIPFIELASGLVQKSNGVVAFVVSDGVTYAPYAEQLTNKLSKDKCIKLVSHFNKPFNGWAFPATCFVLDYASKVPSLKRVHKDNDPSEIISEKVSENPFLTDGKEKVINYFLSWKGLNLEDLFYISKGMVLNRHEKYLKPENTCVYKNFEKSDLIVETSTASKTHPVRYIESEDLDFGKLSNKKIKFIEHGPKTRVPNFVSRPTFPDLHSGIRILLGRSKQGGVFALVGEDAIASDNTIILKRWDRLSKVEAKSVCIQRKDLLKKLKLDDFKVIEMASASCSEELVIGILMSDFYRNWIRNDERHKHNVVPDVISQFPFPIIFNSKKLKFESVKYDMLFTINLEKYKKSFSHETQFEISFHIEEIVNELLSKKKNINRGILQNYLNELVELYYRPVTDSDNYKDFFVNNSLEEVNKTLKLIGKLKSEATKKNQKNNKVKKAI